MRYKSQFSNYYDIISFKGGGVKMFAKDLTRDNSLILIADDDSVTRKKLSDFLRNKSWRVIEAVNGEEAIEKYQEAKPNLILMDDIMPELDGFASCDRIQKLPRGKMTPIIMICSSDNDICVNKAFAAGATDYVFRPLDFEILGARIARLLRNGFKKYHDLYQIILEQFSQTGNMIPNLFSQEEPENILNYLSPAYRFNFFSGALISPAASVYKFLEVHGQMNDDAMIKALNQGKKSKQAILECQHLYQDELIEWMESLGNMYTKVYGFDPFLLMRNYLENKAIEHNITREKEIIRSVHEILG